MSSGRGRGSSIRSPASGAQGSRCDCRGTSAKTLSSCLSWEPALWLPICDSGPGNASPHVLWIEPAGVESDVGNHEPGSDPTAPVHRVSELLLFMEPQNSWHLNLMKDKLPQSPARADCWDQLSPPR